MLPTECSILPPACLQVAPSLPGYLFSEAPRSPGFDVAAIGRLMDNLMRQLGYSAYSCIARVVPLHWLSVSAHSLLVSSHCTPPRHSLTRMGTGCNAMMRTIMQTPRSCSARRHSLSLRPLNCR